MTREQLELMKNLQAYEFTAFEFNLYLDTHPTDQRALAEFHCANQEAKRLQQVYSTTYSPLMAEDSTNPCIWQWAEDPWPWDLDY